MRLYTAEEAAEILRVKKKTVWIWGRQGKLETVRFGRTVRYKLNTKEEGNDGTEVQINTVCQQVYEGR